MNEFLDELRRTHGVVFSYQHAGSQRRSITPDGEKVFQTFQVRAFASGRGALFRIPVSDDVAEGILRPEDHPHYPMTGDELFAWKLWTTVFDDADEQSKKTPEDRQGYWPYAEHLFGHQALVQLLTRYRQTEKMDIEAGIPQRLRYVHEYGHRLANTGQRAPVDGRGNGYLFRCVDCKRTAHMYRFAERDCWIPTLLDPEYRDGFQQLVFCFVHRVNDSGSMPFAIWHRDAPRAVLYAAEGAELDTLDVPEGIGFDDLLALVIDTWGSLSSVQFSMST